MSGLDGVSDDDLLSMARERFGDRNALVIGGPKNSLRNLSDDELMALANRGSAPGVPSPGPTAPIGPMGSDGVSGDEIRAANAGNTRAQMRPQDIASAYDVAQARGDRPEQQAMANAYVRREQADSPKSMAFDNTLRQVAKGVPVLGGIADEVNAAAAAGMNYAGSLGQKGYGTEYEKALDYQRARDTAFESDHPVVSTGLQLGGGIASGLGAAAKVAPMVNGFSRAAILGTGLGGGATLGAVDGFTRGEGLEDRAKQAGIGGTVGGIVGVGAPVVAKGIQSTYARIADALSTNRQISSLGVTRPAADVLHRTLQADDALGAGAQRITDAGPGAMLADAGPSTAGLADYVMQSPGPGALTARRAIDERATNARYSIEQALNASLGRPAGLETAENAIRQGTASARDATYRAAYAQPINYAHQTGQDLEGLLQQVPGDVITRANRLMQLQGERSQQILANIADDGTVTFRQQPDVRQIDYITRALNDAAKAGDGAGALGGQTAMGSAYQNLSRQMRGLMRQNVPAYGHALDTAGDAISRKEALDLGAGLLSPRMTRDEVSNAVQGMSRPEISAVRQGIRSQIDDAIANVTRVASDPNLDAREATKALRDLSSRSAREKVAAVIGQPEADRLFVQLDQASRAFELRAATANNSRTYGRLATDEVVKEAAAPGAFKTLLQGKGFNATQRLVQAVTGEGPQREAAVADRIRGEIARLLTEPRGQRAQDVAYGLLDAYQRKGRNQVAAALLARMGAGGIAGGLFQSGSSTARGTQ